MPSILSRFKKSPSNSSSLGDVDPEQPFSQHDGSSSDEETTEQSSREYLTSRSPNKSGSVFIEDLDQNILPSPTKRTSALSSTGTVTPGNGRSAPLVIPGSASKPPHLGTPRLVLTEEGSSSPRSFSSNSPSNPTDSTAVNLGLGSTSPQMYKPGMKTLNGNAGGQRLNTETAGLAQPLGQSISSATVPAETVVSSPDLYTANGTAIRDRSGSVLSANSAGSDTSISRRGSIASRVVDKLQSASLLPVDSRSSKSKKSKKNRRKSVSSSIATGGIAAALAKSGLHIGSGLGHDDLNSAVSINSGTTGGTRHNRAGSTGTGRSPFLTRGKMDEDDASYLRGEGDDEASARHEAVYDDDDDDVDDDDDTSSDERSLPVTGFAVASNRRNTDFHTLFPTVDEGDYLIEDYGCALSKDILVQGRLYVSENHLCFHANILGWVTHVVIPFADIKTIEKKMTALVIPNAIGVSTNDSKQYTLASLISRDTTYDVMMNIWRLSHPNAVMSSVSLSNTAANSRPGSIAGDDAPNTASTGVSKGTAREGGKGGKGHKPTRCACGKEGKHYSETALDTVFPSTPEKVYNLMFTSEWFKTFLSENQKLKDIETSDWRPKSSDDKLLGRSISYIKPLNGSIGPKQTKCHITDEQEHYDLDNYITMLTTTKTPDVPSGGVFSVKTKTCFMWAGANSTKVLVTTVVEWTGKSWVKGIIEKSCIEGQKTYHDDLETGMRAYMKEHHSEFVGEGGDDEIEEETIVTATPGKPTISTDGNQPTEAEAYAAKARRQRHEQDATYLQAGLDTLVSGIKGVGSGLKIVLDTIADLISDTPMSKELIMGLVILLLVLSNLYTYFRVGSNSDRIDRKARRLGGGGGGKGESEGEMAEAVRLLIQNAHGKNVETPLSVPRDEALELKRIVGEVEKRLERLKGLIDSSVRSVEGFEGMKVELD